ncbi:MAG: hypothetical protein ACTSYT_03445 [Candidatus Asgardarchaeia archaeon]
MASSSMYSTFNEIIEMERELLKAAISKFKGEERRSKTGEYDLNKDLIIPLNEKCESLFREMSENRDEDNWEICKKLIDLKFRLESLYYMTNTKVNVPDPIMDSIEDLFGSTLLSMKRLSEVFEQPTTPHEVLVNNVKEIGRLERLADQTHIVIYKQISSLLSSGNGADRFSLLVLRDIAENMEVILDIIEDISKIVSL